MSDAREKFKKYVKKIKFSDITIPIIANVTARPYKQEEVRKNIFDQITTPVKWMESIRYLLAKGAFEFEEVGPDGVVKPLAMRVKWEAGPLDITLDEEEQIKDETGQKQVMEEVRPSKFVKKVKGKISKKLKPNKNKIKLKSFRISPESLGSQEFKADYNLKYAYVSGGMYKGIASKEMVVRMGKAGFLGFFGTGGLELGQIENALQYIKKELNNGESFGMNLIANPNDSELEEKTVELFLKYRITIIEAAAYMQITPTLIKYRVKGLDREPGGGITIKNRIIAKVSRPEVAEQFLSPAPERIVKKMLEAGKIPSQEADLLKEVPMVDDLCVEADSGGHTDRGIPYTLMPAMIRLRDEMMEKYGYAKKIRVGSAGGIGTPEAGAAAFILGADFILTGSINQCTVEAGTSETVKDLLQQINVQDTDYAPAADMFEMGAKVQVLKRGLFFPARATKLYDLYRQYNSLDEIDEKTKKQLQERYFKRTFRDIYEKDVKSFYSPQEIEKAERNPKHKMALVFKWYLGHGSYLAITGSEEQKVDYQVPCGSALGAFNQWVKSTELENWRNRHVDEIGAKLMTEAAELLNQRFRFFISKV
jgi:trans-AT polyketide synthase/acyltransferase/oxidoreductase domain-containing protein